MIESRVFKNRFTEVRAFIIGTGGTGTEKSSKWPEIMEAINGG
jgi:hypothetical protein